MVSLALFPSHTFYFYSSRRTSFSSARQCCHCCRSKIYGFVKKRIWVHIISQTCLSLSWPLVWHYICDSVWQAGTNLTLTSNSFFFSCLTLVCVHFYTTRRALLSLYLHSRPSCTTCCCCSRLIFVTLLPPHELRTNVFFSLLKATDLEIQ